ncbi:MAG: hypothetical protein RL101_996, partial [Actinomycetota bacterium]
MIGLVVFAIEYVVRGRLRALSAVSFVGSVLAFWLAKSAGVGFAVMAIAVAAVVAISVEGKDRDVRHRTYRWVWAVAGVIAV